MSDNSDSGFGKKTHVNGPNPKTDPGPTPITGTQTTVLTSSVAFRDWVIADREFKENSPRPKYN